MGSQTTVDEPTTNELRRDIARTQREMSETIDEIHYRLSPRYLMNQTKESARRVGVSTSQKFMNKVKENPIPAAMVGVGLWLLMRGSDDGADTRDYGYRADYDFREYGYDEPSKVDRVKEKASEAVDAAKEKASHLADTTKDKAADLAESTREATAHAADVARRKAWQARQQSRDFLRDSPLVAGLAAIAFGAMIAAAIPETDKEDELLGETRDRLMDRGKDLAREGINKAKHVAEAATETAKNEMKSTTSDTKTQNAPSFR